MRGEHLEKSREVRKEQSVQLEEDRAVVYQQQGMVAYEHH